MAGREGIVACFPKGTLNHLIQSQIALPICVSPIKFGCRGWSRTNISVIQSHSDFPYRPLGNEWLPQ